MAHPEIDAAVNDNSKKTRQRRSPQRRSYSVELEALQKRHSTLDARVCQALSILERAAASENVEVAKELLAIGIETLKDA